MVASTVPSKSLLPSVHNFSSLQLKEVIQPKCMSPRQGCRKKSRNLVREIKRKGISSSNNCSISQKKEVDEFEDEKKELVSSCNPEDKKKIRSLKFIIEIPSKEKKIAEEDEKQTANLVDEKPVARTWNFRPRRKTNSRYASSVLEETSESEKEKKREFVNSLTKEEIEEDYFHLMGKPPRRIKTNKKKRVR